MLYTLENSIINIKHFSSTRHLFSNKQQKKSSSLLLKKNLIIRILNVQRQDISKLNKIIHITGAKVKRIC